MPTISTMRDQTEATPEAASMPSIQQAAVSTPRASASVMQQPNHQVVSQSKQTQDQNQPPENPQGTIHHSLTQLNRWLSF